MSSSEKSHKSLVSAVMSNSPETVSVVSKETKPGMGNDKIIPDISYMNKMMKSANNKKELLDNMLVLFPDMELAIQILVSSIVSPADLTSETFFLKTNNINLPSEVISQVNNLIKTTLTNTYKINELMSEMPRDVLFTYGSYTKVVLPENVLDVMVNRSASYEDITKSAESLFDVNKNDLLGTSSSIMFSNGDIKNGAINNSTEIKVNIGTSIESTGISVHDNLSVMQASDLNKLAISKSIESSIGNMRTSNSDFDPSILYTDHTDDGEEGIMEVPNSNDTSRESITRPLVLKIPSASIIPVHSPGDPTKQVGIFIPLDENGSPVSTTIKQSDLNSRLRSQINNTAGRIIKKARDTVYNSNNSDYKENKNIVSQYRAVVEADLYNRFKTGIYKGDVEIADVESVYTTLLYRGLSKKKTRLLYIPKEYYTYFANNYYDNGVGRSLTDNLVIITSIRSMLLFSKLTAMVKNSIPNTLVTATLPENVADPEKLAEKIVSQVLNTAGARSAVGILKVDDLSEWASRLGIEFAFEGHPALEGTKLSYERRDNKVDIPDDDLEEELRKRTIMTFGLTPEQLDNSLGPEFATSIVNNNILFNKRISGYHKVFNPQVTDHAKKVCRNDIILKNGIYKILRGNESSIKKLLKTSLKNKLNLGDVNVVESITMAILDNIEISYPTTDTTSLNTLTEQYADYSDAVDKAIDAIVNADIVDSEVAGEIADNIDNVREVYKAHLLRKWMADKNYLPEILDIISSNEDGKPNVKMVDLVAGYTEALMGTTYDYAKKLSKSKKSINTKLNKIDDDTDDGVEGGEGTDADDEGDTLGE